MAKTIVEASIQDLQEALSTGRTTSVELTVKHLLRIAKYDRRTILLNSTPIINLNAFEAAQASDDLRAAGKVRSDLEGIPCTIKDSYKIKGMTVASGSPAFENLIATEDAFAVDRIKAAGGVILGKTNMPPMAAGGMQRGLYGRAESPYNENYLTAAFASGSSNGSATATAASFGVFGMGEETISSGRSPASNNGLVAYTPSRGMISIRGNWPLFPNCDTVVPHTRSVKDMLSLLDILVVPDADTRGDFWREQPFLSLPSPETIRPASGTFKSLADPNALNGKTLGVPKMYIGEHHPDALPVHIRPSVRALWDSARRTLEKLGATVKEVFFPLVSNLEKIHPKPTDANFTPISSQDLDMLKLMAYTWDDFLKINNGSSLADIDPQKIFPHPKGALPDRYGKDDPLVKCSALVEAAKQRPDNLSVFSSIPNLASTLKSFESTRHTFTTWLTTNSLDAFIWPCQNDVAPSDADTNPISADAAWRNGVLYSNGNCAIRLYGIPTVNVPIGKMKDTGMPVNLTFAGRGYSDAELLKYGFAFESARKGRERPGRMPALASDGIDGGEGRVVGGRKAPKLSFSTRRISSSQIEISGFVDAALAGGIESVQVFVDGEKAGDVRVAAGEEKKSFSIVGKTEPVDLKKVDGEKVPDIEDAMVIVLVKGQNGRASAGMRFVPPHLKGKGKGDVARL